MQGRDLFVIQDTSETAHDSPNKSVQQQTNTNFHHINAQVTQKSSSIINLDEIDRKQNFTPLLKDNNLFTSQKFFQARKTSSDSLNQDTKLVVDAYSGTLVKRRIYKRTQPNLFGLKLLNSKQKIMEQLKYTIEPRRGLKAKSKEDPQAQLQKQKEAMESLISLGEFNLNQKTCLTEKLGAFSLVQYSSQKTECPYQVFNLEYAKQKNKQSLVPTLFQSSTPKPPKYKNTKISRKIVIKEKSQIQQKINQQLQLKGTSKDILFKFGQTDFEPINTQTDFMRPVTHVGSYNEFARIGSPNILYSPQFSNKRSIKNLAQPCFNLKTSYSQSFLDRVKENRQSLESQYQLQRQIGSNLAQHHGANNNNILAEIAKLNAKKDPCSTMVNKNYFDSYLRFQRSSHQM